MKYQIETLILAMSVFALAACAKSNSFSSSDKIAMGDFSSESSGSGGVPAGAFSSFSISAEGGHLTSPTCPQGFLASGAVSDGGGGTVSGNQVFCQQSYQATDTKVITDIFVTAGGNHVVGGLACPQGFTPVGSVADCTEGPATVGPGGILVPTNICSGNQVICAAYSDASAATKFVTAFATPGYGSHLPGGPPCPIFYSSVGLIGDCNGGVCHGQINVCVKH